MKFLKIALLLALCNATISQTAVFKIFNQTSNTIQVFSPSASGQITSLKPGQAEEYNTGLNDVNQIKWTEIAMQDLKNIKPPMTYAATVRLGKLNLGGRFEVFTNGEYQYDFGVDGNSNGRRTATVQRLQ